MEGGKKTRTENEQGACWFPKSCSSASWRREAAALGDSKAPGTARSPAPCLVSASCARSPRLALPLSPSLPGSQPRRALPRPLPLPSPPPPPPASRKRVAPRRATRWGRPCWGRGPPGSPAAVYLTAAWTLVTRPGPSLLPGFLGWGLSRTRGPTK